MAGKIKFKRKPRTGHWAQSRMEWLSRTWQAFLRWLQDLRRSRRPAIHWKTLAGDRQRRRSLVLKNSELHCPACGEELVEGTETVRCTLDPTHVVHARCSKELVKGKCPRDGGVLEAAT